MSEIVKTWTQWLNSSRFSYMTEEQRQQTLRWLFKVRDIVLDRAKIQEGETVIDVGTGTGLLAFGAYEDLKGTGKVILSDAFVDCLEECKKIAQQCNIDDKLEFLQSSVTDIKYPDNSVDVVMMRSVLVHVLDKQTSINECYRILKEGGRLSMFEPIIRKNTKYYELITPENFSNFDKLKDVEDKMTSDENDPLLNFDEHTLNSNLIEAGFKNIDIRVSVETSSYEVQESMIEPWFNTPPSPDRPTLKQRYLQYLSEEELNEFIDGLRKDLIGKTIILNSPVAYIYAEK